MNPPKYKKYLVKEIDKRVGDKCNSQKCWTKLDFVKNMELEAMYEFTKYTYRPDSPQGKFEWLGTFDINDSMAQYEASIEEFKFFGAVPMDFADLSGLEVSNINYDDYYKKGRTKFGVVFNLDNHTQSGSHWVALYTDLKKGEIYFFDSFGTKPGKRVRCLMRQIARYMNKRGIKYNDIVTDYNKIQHQKQNTECGVYSMNFIIRMAKGEDFNKLCEKAVTDNSINKCREVYFDQYNHRKN